MSLFLEESEVARLTGIFKGAKGEHKYILQAKQLRSMGIPFFVNARKEPVVARSFFENPKSANLEQPTTLPWAPRALQDPVAGQLPRLSGPRAVKAS